MGSVHIREASDDEHFENMRKMLEKDDAHFLIGGVVRANGEVCPVTFCRALPDSLACAISDKTPKVVADLLASLQKDFAKAP